MSDEQARDQAKSQLGSIIEIMDEIETCNNDEDEYQGEYSIEELDDQLLDCCIDVQPPDQEYHLLLCTGGPAVRVVVGTDRGEVDWVRLEYQDWGTPWTRYSLSKNEEAYLLEFAQRFEPYGGCDGR